MSHYLNRFGVNDINHNSIISAPIWTAILTIIGGVVLFVLQKFIEKIFINPIQDQKGTIEQISICLIKYAHFFSNPLGPNYPSDSPQLKEYMAAANITRELASVLHVRTNNVPLYNFWEKVKYVRPKSEVITASKKLMILSNSYFNMGNPSQGIRNAENADIIRDLLGIFKFD